MIELRRKEKLYVKSILTILQLDADLNYTQSNTLKNTRVSTQFQKDSGHCNFCVMTKLVLIK